MAKIHYDRLVQDDIDAIRSRAALNCRQEAIFSALLSGRLLDEGIALELGMSRASYYRAKRQMQEKIRRVLSPRGSP